MPVVENYWSGVLRRLQAEVDVFNELIAHPGERGRENELSFARVLSGLVPRRYGIGTGIIIDSDDQYSRQTDIVIYDQADEPAVLAQTNQVLFPIENVRACVEIKTSVGTEEIKDAAKKAASMANLHSRHEPAPLFALLGYRATSHPRTLANELSKLQKQERPNLVCVINTGFVAGDAEVLSPEPPADADYLRGVALLQNRDENGERVQGSHFAPDVGERYFSAAGVTYPAVKVDSALLVAEPSRALLIFCEALVRRLAMDDGRPVPAITHYLTAVARDLYLLD